MRTKCSRCNDPIEGKQAYCKPCKADVQREYRAKKSKGPRWAPWQERLVARLEHRGECLVATHGQDAGGYPQIFVEGCQRRVHNVWWELVHGPVAEGFELDHYCRVWGKMCVTHLEPVTHAENIRRGYASR